MPNGEVLILQTIPSWILETKQIHLIQKIKDTKSLWMKLTYFKKNMMMLRRRSTDLKKRLVINGMLIIRK